MNTNHYNILFVGRDLRNCLADRVPADNRRNGFQFVCLPGASELWYYLDQQAVMPQLLLLDIDLPDHRGLEVLETLRDHPVYQTIDTVVCTSLDDPEWEAMCRQAGANQILLKREIN
ncbi:response regulator [Larkinella soli]|uniref:response regulator n=1 Tax=Larkinella soli TaxID=1770527 RepID=UPI0013E2D0B1|nr:response regulator [Larkinella soli]